MRDHAAEGTKIVLVCLEIGIAEIDLDIPGLANQIKIDHPAWVASVERAREHRFVKREGCSIDPDSKCEGNDGDGGEPGVAEQGAGSVFEILQNGLGQDHQVDLAHALSPQERIAKTASCVAVCLRRRHAMVNIPLFAH